MRKNFYNFSKRNMKISLNDLKPVLISMKTLKISCSSQQNFLLKNSLEFIKTTAVPLKFQNNQFNRTYILSDGSSFKIKSMLLNHMGMKIPFSDKSSLIFLATSHDSSPIGGKIIKNISLENDSNLKQITHPIKNVNCPIEITNDDMNEFCKIDDSYCNVIRPFKNLEGTKAQEAYMSMIKTGLHVLVYSNFYYKTTGELPFTKLISNGTDILNRAILMHLTASEVPDIQNIEKLSEISKLSKTPLNYSNEDAVA